MTRNKLALFVASAYHAFDMVPEVHEIANEHGIISRDQDLWSLRRLERLPKQSLCVILRDLVEVASCHNNPDIAKYASLVSDALFSVDPPYKGGFDSLLNSDSTPKPVWGLLSSLAQYTGKRSKDFLLFMKLSYSDATPEYPDPRDNSASALNQ